MNIDFRALERELIAYLVKQHIKNINDLLKYKLTTDYYNDLTKQCDISNEILIKLRAK